jgi:3-phosphoglycerate kinase
MGLDIGPDSILAFSSALETTQTVIWNGPMGVFEFDKFSVGTKVMLCDAIVSAMTLLRKLYKET